MEEMTRRALLTGMMLLIGSLIYFTACEAPVSADGESYNLYDGLEEEAGTSNVIISQGEAVGRDAWFEFEIEKNDSQILAPGIYDGWCIEWTKPIAQQGDMHESLDLYSTQGQERWKPLNYFLNIKDDLKAGDPDLTFREFQAVMWSVIPGPKFDLETLSVDELPPRLRSNGKPNFDMDKVKSIVADVKAGASSFDDEGKKYAMLMKTKDDEQDVMVPVDPDSVSHGYVEGVTPSEDPRFAERTYPVVQADWEGPGGDSRWLGWNLGATDAPESFTDDDPDRAGWYFYFQYPQGYWWNGEELDFVTFETDGEIIPDDEFASAEDIRNGPDPCTEALGGSWRTPTVAEWQALADADVADEMQFHQGGVMSFPSRFPPSGEDQDVSRYWTSEQNTPLQAYYVEVNSDGEILLDTVDPISGTNVLTVRCIEG